jgi:hypothetical protein
MASFVLLADLDPAIFPRKPRSHRQKESFKRAEKELDGVRRLQLRALNWTERNIHKRSCKSTTHQFFSTSVAMCKFSICRASASARAADALHADGAAPWPELAARGLVSRQRPGARH